MRLIFLHGLGQGPDSWEKVIQAFPDDKVSCLELFDKGRLPKNLDILSQCLHEMIEDFEEDTVVIGLSLGAMLALSLLEHPSTYLKGIVACAGQYRFKHNKAYQFQVSLFRLFPKSFFKKHGMDKVNVLSFYQGMANFDLTETLKRSQVPCQLICGDRDKINLKTSKELLALMPHARLALLPRTGHESNKENPKGLAQTIASFLQEIGSR